jgi:hypothetical protein
MRSKRPEKRAAKDARWAARKSPTWRSDLVVDSMSTSARVSEKRSIFFINFCKGEREKGRSREEGPRNNNLSIALHPFPLLRWRPTARHHPDGSGQVLGLSPNRCEPYQQRFRRTKQLRGWNAIATKRAPLAGLPKRIGTTSPVTDSLRTSIKHFHVKGGRRRLSMEDC